MIKGCKAYRTNGITESTNILIQTIPYANNQLIIAKSLDELQTAVYQLNNMAKNTV
jgi:hypothetical protein